MKKLDFRSVLIGFLMAVIFFLITGQTTNSKVAEFDYVKANRMEVETLNVNGMQIQTLLVTGSMGVYNSGKTAVFISTTRDGEGAIYVFDRNENPAQVITGKK